MDAFYQFESDRSDLEFLLRSGNTDGARLLATRLHESAEDRDPVTRAWLLDVLVQLGAPARDLSHLLDRTVAETDSPLIVALARRTRAKAEDDAAALDGAAADLSELGAFGLAGAASDDAARLHDRDGDCAAAAQSREDAELSSVASRGLTHLLPPRGPHSGALLTGREREISALVSQGLSNRAIASDLFLSVRTVESHLYKARVKTGLSARSTLSAGTDTP
nr:helix-turn-helix transcriptional regulator [Cryobacterium roopkundense]